MDVTRLRAQLERDEGRRYECYVDTLGNQTIGIGHTGPEVHEGLVWTNAQIDRAFLDDIGHAMHGVLHRLAWARQLDDARLGALLNMAFQMGVRGLLGFPKMLAALKAGDWQEAKTQALDSRWARQTPARAQRVAYQIFSGEWT